MASNVDFTNEAEVKEYLERIGIEYRFGCYSEKRPEVCHLLGMYFENIKREVEKAKKIYKVNCDTHSWSLSCYKYAYLQDAQQDKRNVDEKELLRYFIKGCESQPEFNKACLLAGSKLGIEAETQKEDKGRKEKFHKALEYMDKACNQKLGVACFQLGSIYFDGIPAADIPKSMQKFYEYSMKGCDELHIESCINLSVIFTKGEGGFPKDPVKAKQFKDRALELYKQISEKGVQFEEGI